LNKLRRATILSHKPAGRGYYRITLKAPEVAAAAVPGQFVMLRVTENLDPLLARPLGIFSLPSKSSIEISTASPAGDSAAHRAEAGQTLSCSARWEKGSDAGQNHHSGPVTGGSGFPPLHFMSLRTKGRAQVFVGARNKECLPPISVLKSFRDHSIKLTIATEDGSAGRKGMSTDILNAFLTKFEKKTHFVLYACGPHAMLAAVSRIAEEHSITCYVSEKERMACGFGVCMGCSIPMKSGGYKRACKEGPVFDSREIEWSSKIVIPIGLRR
jgi:dihydroorotate dehydrogenase electron transfer subunit